jgi:hypothetical protein
MDGSYFFHWIGNTCVAEAMNGSEWLFPVLNERLTVFDAMSHAFWYRFDLPEAKEAFPEPDNSVKVLLRFTSLTGASLLPKLSFQYFESTLDKMQCLCITSMQLIYDKRYAPDTIRAQV